MPKFYTVQDTIAQILRSMAETANPIEWARSPKATTIFGKYDKRTLLGKVELFMEKEFEGVPLSIFKKIKETVDKHQATMSAQGKTEGIVEYGIMIAEALLTLKGNPSVEEKKPVKEEPVNTEELDAVAEYIKAVEKENKELRAQIEVYEKNTDVADLTKEREDLKDQLSQAKERISVLEKYSSDLEVYMKSLEAETKGEGEKEVKEEDDAVADTTDSTEKTSEETPPATTAKKGGKK